MIREDEKGELLYEVGCAGSLSIEFTKEELEGMIHELEIVDYECRKNVIHDIWRNETIYVESSPHIIDVRPTATNNSDGSISLGGKNHTTGEEWTNFTLEYK